MVEKTKVYIDPYREKYYLKGNKKKKVEEPNTKTSEDPMVDEAIKRKDYEFANALLSKERMPDPVMDKIKDTVKSFEEKDLEIDKEEIVHKVLKQARERGDI